RPAASGSGRTLYSGDSKIGGEGRSCHSETKIWSRKYKVLAEPETSGRRARKRLVRDGRTEHENGHSGAPNSWNPAARPAVSGNGRTLYSGDSKIPDQRHR